MSVLKDLNNRRYRSGAIEIPLDMNSQIYYLQEQGNALVVVEKYAKRKISYTPSILGVPRESNRNQILIKEDGFTDIGGGMITFLRHYAQIPEPWYSFEEKSALVYEHGGMMGINYDSFQGNNAFGNTGFNYKGANRRSMNFLCKASRYYVTKERMDEYIEKRYTLEGSFAGQGTIESTFKVVYFLGVILIFEIKGKGFTGSFLRPNMLGLGELDEDGKRLDGDNVFLVDENTGFDYPKRLYINAPLGSIQKTDNSECVIAPDRIRLWQPGIYEITRYTSTINLLEADFESITVQVFYNFDNNQVFTADEIASINVTLFEGLDLEQTNADPLNYYLFKDLDTADEQASEHSIPVKVETTLTGVTFGVNGASVQVQGGTYLNETQAIFQQGNINVQWNGEKPKVIVNFNISKVLQETI